MINHAYFGGYTGDFNLVSYFKAVLIFDHDIANNGQQNYKPCERSLRYVTNVINFATLMAGVVSS